MFWDVPGCSGMFRDVPCSGFYRRPCSDHMHVQGTDLHSQGGREGM